jgi:SAM-dependent methyltransferase
MPQNIAYQSDVIGDFYSTHRRRWQDFYQSERHVLDTLARRWASFANVLDVGCAAGGLGDALSERFGSVKTYTGVDINKHAVDVAAKLASGSGPDRKFIVADICDCGELVDNTFDLVTLFGVADWNVDARGIVAKCWERVRPNGHLVVSLRLTPHRTVCDIARSFQFVWFEPTPPPSDAERAPYSVFNLSEAIAWLAAQTPRPEHLYLYGYWGRPSDVARTPYERLLFSVFALRKPPVQVAEAEPTIEAHLPASAFSSASAADVDRV